MEEITKADRNFIITVFILIVLVSVGTVFLPPALAQRSHKLSGEEVRQIMENDRARLQKRLDDEHELWAKEHDQRLIAEAQNAQLTKKLSDIRRVLDRR